MKLILLAAVAVASPAFAQQTGTMGTTGTDSPTTMGTQSGMNGDSPAPATQTMPDSTMQQPMNPSMQQPMGQSMQPPMSNGGMANGGYQPAQPPMAGPAPAGARVVFQQAPSVDQAYPAPAPKASYPPCKRGQTDGCTQRGGR